MANIYYVQFAKTWKIIAILGGGGCWVWTGWGSREGGKEEGEVRERTLSTSSISSMELSQERKGSWFMWAYVNDSLQAEFCKSFLACLTGLKKKKSQNWTPVICISIGKLFIRSFPKFQLNVWLVACFYYSFCCYTWSCWQILVWTVFNVTLSFSIKNGKETIKYCCLQLRRPKCYLLR